jgi:hypothetical protein
VITFSSFDDEPVWSIQEDMLERNIVPPYVVDFVLSNDENITDISGRTSFDVEEGLEMNEEHEICF